MIRRRRLVLVAGLLTVLLMAVGAVGSVLLVTGTDTGRGWLRSLIVSRLTPAVKGRLHVGRITGPILTGMTLDSLEIADSAGVVMIAAGRTTMRWDPRDFLDRRILIQRLVTDNVLIRIIKYRDGDWNYKHIFPPGPKGAPRAKGSFGEFVVLDSVSLTRGRFLLTMPWTPSDSLKGVKRDSAIAFNLARTNAQIRRGPRGIVRTWRWEEGHMTLSHVRLAHPDSSGRIFRVSDLGMTEFDPPFRFDRVRGDFRWQGDSIWMQLPHFELPGSAGRATGKVVWGSNLPTRYDIAVTGEKVAMNDIAWLTTTFPRDGGGTMDLHIDNDPRNLNILRYAISNMDARSLNSRLRGRMTWGVGGPVLTLTGVDMRADPLDFALLRQFNGIPFPYPWRGQIAGTVRARGGPLHRFDVDDMRFEFSDANVPGALSRGRGRGQVDILYPAFTQFRGFTVEVDRADLRTPRFLNKEFARLNGAVRGTARLDSLWYDIRVSDLDVYHDDFTGATPSHVTGGGRITLEPAYVLYDMQLNAEPLSFTMLGNSYALLPLRGTMTGPITVKGTIAALEVTGQLTGDAGSLTGSGVLDIEPAGYGIKGQAAFDRVDVRTLLQRNTSPATQLTGRLDADLRGDSLSTLSGRASLSLDRSRVEALRISDATAQLSFAEGIARVDSLSLSSPALTIGARGGLGLSSLRSDSLMFRITADSLGGLRPWLSTAGLETPDSLGGTITLRGRLSGNIDSVGVSTTLSGRDLLRGTLAAAVADVTATGAIVRGVPSGSLQFEADSVSAGPVRLNAVTARGSFDTARNGTISVAARADSGVELRLEAAVRSGATDSSIVATVGTLYAAGPRTRWSLRHPATITQSSTGSTLDSLVVGDTGVARLRISANVPRSGALSLLVDAARVPLRDIGWLTRRERPLTGLLDWRLDVRGTRDAPSAALTARANGVTVGTTPIGDARLAGTYDARSFRGEVSLSAPDSSASLLSASLALPLTATFGALPTLDRNAPVSGSLRLANTPLALFEAATSAITDASGTLAGELQLRGSVGQPRLDGTVNLVAGAGYVTPLGIRLVGMDGALRFAGDNLSLPRLTVSGAGSRGGSAILSGRIGFASLEDPSFDLRVQASNLRILDRPRIATLQVSTDAAGLQIRGTEHGSVLTGNVTIPTGDIRIPELGVAKNLVSIDDPEFFTLIDTTTTQGRSLLAAAPSPLLRNLEVRDVRLLMGNNVWLRSAEANIKLAGDVGVTLGRARQDSTRVQLALDGTLLAERGTYRLNLVAVQRTFDVERGTLRFFGEPELNPALDIQAVNIVRQYTRQDRDIPVRITIGGTLEVPTLKLGSGDPSLVLSESDAISYLFTGRPSFAVTTAADQYSSQFASVVLPTLGSALGDRVGRVLGVDQFQIETAGGVSGQQFGASSVLASTRLGGGVQIGGRIFVSANVGLCQLFGSSQVSTGQPLVNSIGARLEYRFSQWLSASVGREPPTSVLQCNNNVNARNFVPTPQQFGLDITRKWEY